MDSLTQIALGAAVGEAVLGRRVGYRAALWGAVCGTLPDLDVLIDYGGAVEDFTYHRSFSHSLLVMALITPLIVWLILKIHPQSRDQRRRWYVLVYLALATHALLDSFTVYGTQILWPLTSYPVTWSSIFIIDPLYTLPLIVGVLCALIMQRSTPRGHRFNTVGLMLSSAYLAWGVGAKMYVDEVARDSLAAQQIEYQELLTNPGPFNTVLWRVLAMTDDGYYEGFYSLLDDKPSVQFERYDSDPELLTGLGDHWPVQRLQWFTKGFYSVSEQDREVRITDLRMGFEPDYVFSFKVAEISNPHPLPTPSILQPTNQNWDRLPAIWRRIWGI